MKHYLITILLFSTTIMFAQEIKIRSLFDFPYNNEISTNDFIVLDINFEEELIAFKHIYELPYCEHYGGSTDSALNCNYLGMNNYPLSGVVLGVYDIKNQEYKRTFTIYESVYELENCTDYEQSVIMLDSAKQYFLNNKLNIENKPMPINLHPIEIKKETEIINNYELLNTFSFCFEGLIFEYNNIKTYNEYITESELSVKSKTDSISNMDIFIIHQKDYYNMGSGGEFEYICAYQKDNKFVFLHKFQHISGFYGSSIREMFYFTPLFDLNDFK